MTDNLPRFSSQTLARLEHAQIDIEKTVEPSIARYVWFGVLVLIAFVGGAIYWALSSRLDGAVVAPASFVVEGQRKTVEHIDGGIIRAILVDDGQFVQKGQTLVRLDSTDIDVDLNVLGTQIGDLSARRARLLAQLSEQSVFSEADARTQIPDGIEDLQWYSAYLTQQQLFASEARARRTEAEINTQRVESLRDQIKGLEEQRASTLNQLEIARVELVDLESLFEKKLVTVARISPRRIELERLAGNDALLRTQIAQAENQIRELDLLKLSRQKLRAETITSELATVEAQLATLLPQHSGARERRARVDILAPASGRVVNLEVSTAGGVIRPGETILDIVPEGHELIVEARVDTGDIDKLQIGQDTRVRLSAFAQSDVPEATGEIYDISADTLEDDRTGEPFYIARVRLDAEQTREVAELELLPGMPADLFIRTGERTAFSYLAQPISERLAKTFIE